VCAGDGCGQAEESGEVGDGGVSREGPQAHRSPREPAKQLIVSSGPVVLSVRPLSAYQQTLLDTIARLRSNGWNDRQIADHFNAIGWLTPRWREWIPQSVYSVRRKAGRGERQSTISSIFKSKD
jgi:hypothetical protein